MARQNSAFPLSRCASSKDDNSSIQKVQGPTVQPPRPNGSTYWVVPDKLMAGEYPADKRGERETRVKLRQYLDRGVDFFLDLTQQGEKDDYSTILQEEASSKGIQTKYQRLPIRDFGIPKKHQMKVILNAIDQAISNGQTVYVHCRGGIGRTGTTIGCYLARHGNTGEEALEEVNRLFQCSDRSNESYYSPETKDQMDFVKEWSEN